MASDAPDSLHVETPGRRHGRGVDLTLAGLALLVLLYLVTVLPSLGNDPIAGGDEGWIISASARLARDGVFGSDLFKGFYGAENHYYFNLPLHHLMLAGVFEVFGVSLGTARMVSVLFGLAALLLTYALGRGLERYDTPAVNKIVQGVAARDYKWSALVMGIVQSQPFQMRRGEKRS